MKCRVCDNLLRVTDKFCSQCGRVVSVLNEKVQNKDSSFMAARIRRAMHEGDPDYDYYYTKASKGIPAEDLYKIVGHAICIGEDPRADFFISARSELERIGAWK